MINCGLRIADRRIVGWSRRDCRPFQPSGEPLSRSALATQKMPPEPRPQRLLINRQRLGIMKMAAGPVPRGAAGMEDMRPFRRRQAGHLILLERRRGQRRNFPPVRNRRDLSFPAKLPVNRHRVPLQREQRRRQPVKLRVQFRLWNRLRLRPRHKRAQLRHKLVK